MWAWFRRPLPPEVDVWRAAKRVALLARVTLRGEEDSIVVQRGGIDLARVTPWGGGATITATTGAVWVPSEPELRAQLLAVLP